MFCSLIMDYWSKIFLLLFPSCFSYYKYSDLHGIFDFLILSEILSCRYYTAIGVCPALVSLPYFLSLFCFKRSYGYHTMQEILGDCGRAAIQTHGSTSNPFGSTFVYGYPNVAFEVHKYWILIFFNSIFGHQRNSSGPICSFFAFHNYKLISDVYRSWRMVTLQL